MLVGKFGHRLYIVILIRFGRKYETQPSIQNGMSDSEMMECLKTQFSQIINSQSHDSIDRERQIFETNLKH